MASTYRIISPLALIVVFSATLAFRSNPSLSDPTLLSPTETEIVHIRAETYRLAVKENFEIESLLFPVPIGIATMVDLIVMTATLGDFSLEAHPPEGGFRFVKYPKSFHASLQQVSFSAHEAFLKAHINMKYIEFLAEEMSDKVERIERIFESGEVQVIVHIIPKDLESILEAAGKCSQLSNEVVDGFIEVMELTKEVNLATTALKGEKEDLNTKAEETLNLLKSKKEEAERILKQLEENNEKNEAEEGDARKRASEAMDEMPGAIKMIGLRLVDTVFNYFSFNPSGNDVIVEKIHGNAASKLKAAQDELAQVRAEVNEARLQRKKEQEEQIKILTDMGKVTFDKNDYDNAISTLVKGMDNLTKLYQNWFRLRVFFGTIESFIKAKVVRSVTDTKNWANMAIPGETTISITPFIKNEISETASKANEHSLVVYYVASTYSKVSTDYIMKPLNEWSRISNIEGKNKDAIEADRQKVFQLCIEAGSGIRKVLESEEKKPAAQKKITTEQKINNKIEL